MVMAFILVGIITIVSVAFYYGYAVSDKVKLNHITNFGSEIVKNAEAVYYSGSPSRITITPYLPEGVQSVDVFPEEIMP